MSDERTRGRAPDTKSGWSKSSTYRLVRNALSDHRIRLQAILLATIVGISGVAVIPGVTAAQDEFLGINSVQIDGVDRDGDGRYSQFNLDVELDTAHPDEDSEKSFYLELNIWYGDQSGARDDAIIYSEHDPVATGENVQVTAPVSNDLTSYGTIVISLQLHATTWHDVLPRDTETVTVEYEAPSNDQAPDTTEDTDGSADGSADDVEDDQGDRLENDLSVTTTVGGYVYDTNSDRIATTSNRTLYNGSEVNLEARPHEGYEFDRWSGDVPTEHEQDRNITISMDTDVQVTAHFRKEGDAAATTPLSLNATSTRLDDRTLRVGYTVTNLDNTRLAGVQLSLRDVPETWTVAAQSAPNASWAPDEMQWNWQTIAANSSEDSSITFRVPENASRDNVSIVANVSDAAGHSDSVTVASEQDTPVLDLDATTSLSGATASPGENITVEYQVANTNESRLAGVEMELAQVPEDWAVVDQSADGGTWAPDDRKWNWQIIEGESSQNPAVTFRIPPNASAGDYQITAVTSDADGHSATVNTTISLE